MPDYFPVASSNAAARMEPEVVTRLVAGKHVRIACQPIIDLREGAVLGFEC
ncbi:MAG: hypothetical protein QOH68_1721, partial [Nocardioidaceae bacterium]|nr:hypothetical protein [Nocardioidaceae bacterium]